MGRIASPVSLCSAIEPQDVRQSGRDSESVASFPALVAVRGSAGRRRYFVQDMDRLERKHLKGDRREFQNLWLRAIDRCFMLYHKSFPSLESRLHRRLILRQRTGCQATRLRVEEEEEGIRGNRMPAQSMMRRPSLLSHSLQHLLPSVSSLCPKVPRFLHAISSMSSDSNE